MTDTTKNPSRKESWNGMNWIRQEKRLAIYIRDNFTCQHCQIDLKKVIHEGSSLRIELDHLVCVSAGGGNEATNLVTSCSKCNQSRQDKNLYHFHSHEYAQSIIAQAQKSINVALAKQIRAQMRNEKKEEV